MTPTVEQVQELDRVWSAASAKVTKAEKALAKAEKFLKEARAESWSAMMAYTDASSKRSGISNDPK